MINKNLKSKSTQNIYKCPQFTTKQSMQCGKMYKFMNNTKSNNRTIQFVL